jgi:two-component system CheB/CheR fusion protein
MSSRQRIRILVVDDILDVREMLTMFLTQAGFQVTSAESARDALQAASDQSFDLIVSDVGMPDMNGFDLARSLRRLSRYKTVPMIAVTGYSEYEDRERALQSGFNTQLVKPIDPLRLIPLIEELLDL